MSCYIILIHVDIYNTFGICFQILRDSDSRADYDYMLDNPGEYT